MKQFFSAFGFAFSGLKVVFREGRNFRIQVVLFLVVCALAVWLNCPIGEWVALMGCSALVLICEILNSALELLCDHVTPERHEAIKKIKDVAAAAPLIASFLALVTGSLIFIPKLIAEFG
jgi:diacylglycerol kinase (ATP)